MEWSDLVKMDNLCNGAPLVSIVFCCKKRTCPFRDEALKKLGITYERFVEVKEAHSIKAKELCYGNLAYCCSLNVPCETRDKVLKELGWTPADYLKYKFLILRDLIPKEKMEIALKEKVVHLFAFEMVNLDDTDEAYRGLALGNPQLVESLMIVDLNKVNSNIPAEVKNAVKYDEFIHVRVDKRKYELLAKLASFENCNISDVVREAIDLYISLNHQRLEKYIKDKM